MKKQKKKKQVFRPQHKVCQFCLNKMDRITYLDYEFLRKYISNRGKIMSRRITRNCTKHQRRMARAIKQARQLALLSYTGR
jgi:ribosomal protein S18